MEQNKRYMGGFSFSSISTSISIPFFSIFCLCACFLISLQTIFTSAALSLIPLPPSLSSTLLLFHPPSLFHLSALSHLFSISELGCFKVSVRACVCVCVTSRTLHTHTNTSAHSSTYALTRIDTHTHTHTYCSRISLTRTHTHTQHEHGIWTCFCAPWGG